MFPYPYGCSHHRFISRISVADPDPASGKSSGERIFLHDLVQQVDFTLVKMGLLRVPVGTHSHKIHRILRHGFKKSLIGVSYHIFLWPWNVGLLYYAIWMVRISEKHTLELAFLRNPKKKKKKKKNTKKMVNSTRWEINRDVQTIDRFQRLW